MKTNHNKAHQDFQHWIIKKEALDTTKHQRSFSQGEIWWIATGKNVGVEINGKGPNFARPAIIFKKLSSLGCFVIPLTSQKHDGAWYTEFIFNNKVQYAVLAQMRIIGSERLYTRMGRLTKSDYSKIAEHLHSLLFTNPTKNIPNPKIGMGD